MSTQTAETLSQRVIEIISRQMDIPQEQISLDSQFIADLGYDSLDVVEFVMLAEENFDIVVPDEVSETIQSVRDAVQVILKSIS